jgi:hypothetical protein
MQLTFVIIAFAGIEEQLKLYVNFASAYAVCSTYAQILLVSVCADKPFAVVPSYILSYNELDSSYEIGIKVSVFESPVE